MKLIELKKNDVFKIISFENSCKEMKQRLLSMGVKKGSMGQVINKAVWGPIEIDFDGSKLAVGRGMAKKIEVKKYSCPLFG